MKNIKIYGLITVIFIALWEIIGKSNQTIRLLISSPSFIVKFFNDNIYDLLEATGITFFESFIGLLLALIFSFSMMVLCFFYPKLMDFVLPIMITSQIIPLIVLAPFFIILLGIGLSSKIAMASIMCFFPVFVNFAQGYKAINGNIHELLQIYDSKKWFNIIKVYFPLSMPSIMAGLKISATLAVIGSIVAEFNGAEVGLGKNLFLSAKRLEPDLMMSSLLLSTLLGAFMYYLITIIENKFGKWYQN